MPAPGSHRSVRACTNAYGSSSRGFATCAIHGPYGDEVRKFDAFRLGAGPWFHDSTSRFPLPGPHVSRSPDSSVLSGRCDFRSAVSPHFVSFAWQYHVGVYLSAITDGKRQAPVTQGDYCGSPSGRSLAWSRSDLPSSCETPMTCLHMLLRLRRTRSRLAMTPRRLGPQ